MYGDTNGVNAEPPGRLKVGITFNLKKNFHTDAEAEFDDEDTILAIQGALETAGSAVTLHEATEELPPGLLQNRPDIVFNIAEGSRGRGREAQVPAILNFLGLPFTGSDETTMCVAMDKALTKRLVASHGIATPNHKLVRAVSSGASLQNSGSLADPGFSAEAGLSWPVIVKPNTEGSSKGISEFSIVEDSTALRRVLSEQIELYGEGMLVEEYIEGREFTVGILGSGNRIRVFPPMEIIFNDRSRGIYSREVKKNFRQYVSYECPAAIADGTMKELMDSAETVYRSLECRDFARLDFRMSKTGQLFFIEINPIPGLAPGYSDFPMIASFCGMDYTALILGILDSALARYPKLRREYRAAERGICNE